MKHNYNLIEGQSGLRGAWVGVASEEPGLEAWVGVVHVQKMIDAIILQKSEKNGRLLIIT